MIRAIDPTRSVWQLGWKKANCMSGSTVEVLGFFLTYSFDSGKFSLETTEK